MIDITKVYESYIYKNVPEKIFFPEQALSQLLSEEILFANYREITLDGKKCGYTCVLFVNCNDIFAWGCADAEDIPDEEIQTLSEKLMKEKGITKSKAVSEAMTQLSE
jgi:hypothetical protein